MFEPQQYATPLERPQVCPRLALMAEKFKGVETATGQVLAEVVPSPSCPYWLSPAQYMMSPGRTTQVCCIPGASSATGTTAERVDEAVEEEVEEPVLVDVPVDVDEPVLEAVLVEDEVAVGVVEGAQAIAATGVSRLVVVPSPSCPWPLLPQQ